MQNTGSMLSKKYDKMDIVLLALYSEWMKDIPQFWHVNHESLNMEKDVFYWCLAKLNTMGFISGIDWNMEKGKIEVKRNNAILTGKGVERAVDILQVDDRSRRESLETLFGTFEKLKTEEMAMYVGQSLGM